MSGRVRRHEADVVVVGSGFAGLAIAHRLREAGFTDLMILERGDDVGGTWHVNTYPGCQCDVPSHLYSFSFAPNPDWSRTYSEQPEIKALMRRFDASSYVARAGTLDGDAPADRRREPGRRATADAGPA